MDLGINASARRAASSDEFARLLHRLRVLASQLRLAGKDFGDLSRVPKEHLAAALVVQEASTGLNELYDRMHEWHERLGDVGTADAALSAQASISRPSYYGTPSESSAGHRVSLVLREYAPERKVSVIRVLREAVPGTSLTAAKALLEGELPRPIAEGLATEEAQALMEKFAAVGAVCRIASSIS